MPDEPLKLHVSQKKRIAIFIDGTWNVEDNNTNVWRMYSLCAGTGQDECTQLSYYTKGVGTVYGEKIRGGWFGYGLDAIITDAYEWLIAHYNPNDEIFIFGFSRGAYAARALAGFVAKCGVTRPGSPIGVGELFERYKTFHARTLYELLDQDAGAPASTDAATLTLERWMVDYSAPADIKMVGVWDTVGALSGEKGYLETGLRRPVKNAFHAMAIDEHREKFKPTLYTINYGLDQAVEARPHRPISGVEQRWFVGAHANVGGGYDSDLLPQPSLGWLMSKASALDLTFREKLVDDDRVFTARVRDSFKEFAYGAYRLSKGFRPYEREIGAKPQRVGGAMTTNVNETINASAFEHWRQDQTYRPANLQAWAASHALRPEDIHGSIVALDPATTAPP